MDVHTICFIGGTTLNFVLTFYTLEYLFLSFSSRCSSILCCFRCTVPAIGRGGYSVSQEVVRINVVCFIILEMTLNAFSSLFDKHVVARDHRLLLSELYMQILALLYLYGFNF